MTYYELVVPVILKKELPFIHSFEQLSKWVNDAMFCDEELKAFHKNNRLKHYCFSSLYPTEKSGTYEKGRAYVFRIKSFSENFIRQMELLLGKAQSTYFQKVASDIKKWNPKIIGEISTITPAISTIEKGYWTSKNGLMFIEKRIKINLIKKYNDYFNEKLNEDFEFTYALELINEKPIKIPYKNIHFLGNKFVLRLAENEGAQKLGKTALATGLLEKNSLGLGFCMAKFY